MKRSFSIVMIILGLIFFGLFWQGLQKHFARQKHAKMGGTAVELCTAKIMNVPITIKSVGTLQAKQAINISSPMSGIVVAVSYTPGTYVTQGTPLAQLDNRIYQSKLDSDKADVHLKKLQYARGKWAQSKGAVSQADVDLELANYEEAQATLKTDQTNFDQSTIRAAFSGYVGAKNINVGDYLQTGAPVTTLTDRSHLLVNYAFPEQYINQLKLGQKITLTADTQAGKQYEGTVNYISPTVDPSTHSVALQADIPNLNNILSPGLFVRIQQNLGEISSAVVVPEEAIVPTITGSQVYVVRNNIAQVVDVKTGAQFQNFVQITKGIKAGDRVIIVGQSEVHNGSKIREVK